MQRLVYNLTGQTLTHVPDVRRASATWRLEDLRYDIDSSGRLLDSGSVTVDAATETLTAAAGPGTADPRRLTVASTAGYAVGTTYELVSADGDGDRELAVVAGLPTGEILLEHPLIGSYPTGSTIRGITLTTAAIASAVVQSENRVQGDWPMRIVWTYPDGARVQEAVRLVRETAGDILAHRIVADVRDLFPDVDTRMQRHGRDTLMPHVRLQIRQFRAAYLARGLREEEFLGGEKAHWAMVWRVLWHLARLGNAPQADGTAGIVSGSSEWATYCKSEYERNWHALTVGEGGPDVVHVEPVSSTSVSPTSRDETYRRVIGEL